MQEASVQSKLPTRGTRSVVPVPVFQLEMKSNRRFPASFVFLLQRSFFRSILPASTSTGFSDAADICPLEKERPLGQVCFTTRLYPNRQMSFPYRTWQLALRLLEIAAKQVGGTATEGSRIASDRGPRFWAQERQEPNHYVRIFVGSASQTPHCAMNVIGLIASA
jgi:hypothetical protein